MQSNELSRVSHPFLKNLSEAHLRSLSDAAMLVAFDEGECIFREGELANRFYLILEGSVSLSTSTQAHDKLPIQTLGAGDILGWSWLFEPYTWHFDARAIEPTKALFFYGTRLREQCEAEPELGYAIMKRISQVLIQRLQATRFKLLDSVSAGDRSSEVELTTTRPSCKH